MNPVFPNIRIGPTVSWNKTLKQTILPICYDHSSYTCQFMWPSSAIEKSSWNLSEFEEINKILIQTRTTFSIHAPYSINLARKDNLSLLESEIEKIRSGIKFISSLPGSIVLHIGKRCRGGDIEDICSTINSISFPRRQRPILLLENAAGQGSEIGTSLDEIRRLFEKLDSPNGKIGLCFDTQHAFASGMFSFSCSSEIRCLIDFLSDTGIDLRVIHCNDSKKPYCSKVDRHENLFCGYLWKKENFSVLCDLMKYSFEKSIDVIPETSNRNDFRILSSFFI
jgi:deoxyribonuclease-4